MKATVEVVSFNEIGDFEVLDTGLASQIEGGLFFGITKEGDTKINDQCIADNTNTQCIQLNNLCASNLVCPEVDLPI